MQEKPEEIPTKEFAKGLAGLVTLVFWAFCILIGYYIIQGSTGLAVTFLLILGFFLPIVVWSIIALIREKHSGKEVDMMEMRVPFIYGIFFLITFGFSMFLTMQLIPDLYAYIYSL